MFITFFESFKYMGHMWPVALLRIYVGIFFLQAGLHRIHEGFLRDPLLTPVLQKWITDHPHNDKYLTLFQNWMLVHWQITSEVVVLAQVVVGLCFIAGFLVRPMSLIAIFLSLNFMAGVASDAVNLRQMFVALNIALFLLSAGRCFGMDYYFYKRIRGFGGERTNHSDSDFSVAHFYFISGYLCSVSYF